MQWYAYHDAIDAIVVVRIDDRLLDALSLCERRVRSCADLAQDELDAELIALLLREFGVELARGRGRREDADELRRARALRDAGLDLVAERARDGVGLKEDALASVVGHVEDGEGANESRKTRSDSKTRKIAVERSDMDLFKDHVAPHYLPDVIALDDGRLLAGYITE